MKYIRTLDGFRAIAVLLVIFRHWHLPFLNLELGWIGVNFFFVLSGFLITSILLKDKILPLKKFLKTFYLKRTLRIFPIYYLYILVCIIFFVFYAKFIATRSPIAVLDNNLHSLQHNIWGLLTYTFNYHHLIEYFNGVVSGRSKFFGHLWSLAVEEQFYLVFPLIAYFLSRKNLKILAIFILVSSPILRALAGQWLLGFDGNPGAVGLILYKTTIFQLDSLALGILLAVTDIRKIKWSNFIYAAAIGGILLVSLGLVAWARHLGEDPNWSSLGFSLLSEQIKYNTGNPIIDFKYAYLFTIINLLAAVIIVGCVNLKSMFNFLGNKFLVYIGKISYGIYLYHNPIFLLFLLGLKATISVKVIERYPLIEVFSFFIYFTIVILVSHISYRFIEKPFLKIKDRMKQKSEAA